MRQGGTVDVRAAPQAELRRGSKTRPWHTVAGDGNSRLGRLSVRRMIRRTHPTRLCRSNTRPGPRVSPGGHTTDPPGIDPEAAINRCHTSGTMPQRRSPPAGVAVYRNRPVVAQLAERLLPGRTLQVRLPLSRSNYFLAAKSWTLPCSTSKDIQDADVTSLRAASFPDLDIYLVVHEYEDLMTRLQQGS